MLYKDIMEMLNGQPIVISKKYMDIFLENLKKTKKIIKVNVDPEYGKKTKIKIWFTYRNNNGIEYYGEMVIIEKNEDVFCHVEIKNYDGDLDKRDELKSFRYDIIELGMNGFTIKFKNTQNLNHDELKLQNSAIKNALFLRKLLELILK